VFSPVLSAVLSSVRLLIVSKLPVFCAFKIFYSFFKTGASGIPQAIQELSRVESPNEVQI
jgi:hypothetical protein